MKRLTLQGMEGGRFRRAIVSMIGVLAVLALFAPVAPAMAADQTELPTVKDFQSARYDLLAKLTAGDQSAFLYYGQGAVILPDRDTVTLRTPDNQTVSVIVIGTAIYTNDGSGWRRTDDSAPGQTVNRSSTDDQLKQLQSIANSTVLIGSENVRGVATDHYQIWISGDRLTDAFGGDDLPQDAKDVLDQAVIKYDLWIGADGYIHQINSSVNIPETTSNGQDVPAFEVATLITYSSFNDPSISIEAPI